MQSFCVLYDDDNYKYIQATVTSNLTLKLTSTCVILHLTLFITHTILTEKYMQRTV